MVCVLLVVETFSLQKAVKMLKEVAVIWWEVRRIWQMRQNFVAQFIQLFKCWLCDMWSAVVVGKNWALYVAQCWLEVFQFSVHLISLLSIFLKCNGFTGIQKAVVDQIGSKPPNSAPDLFWCNFGFEMCFADSSLSNHWAGHFQLSYKIHFSLHVTILLRNGFLLHRMKEDTSKWQFFNFRSAHEAPIYSVSSPFQFSSNVKWP